MNILFSIDIGLRAGLAWFTEDGRLLRSRSAHFSNRTVLKRALPAVFAECNGVTHVVLEGMGPVADIWLRYIQHLGLPCLQVCAEAWREDMLLLRERRSGAQAKLNAERLAAEVLAANGIGKTTPLGNDEAEAILCGQWALRLLREGNF